MRTNTERVLRRLAAMLLVAIGATLGTGVSGALPGAEGAARYEPLPPVQAQPGLTVAVRLPLGGTFRPGARWPLAVRIESTGDRRVRIAVVPELWQVEATPATLVVMQAPVVDLARAPGGSWSEPFMLNAVGGTGAAGLVAPLMPIFDDARRHLVVMELDDEAGRRGKIIFRGDLTPRLHELLPTERLVAMVTAGEGVPVSAPGENGLLPPIPATVQLPDGSTVTPRLAGIALGDLPGDPAAWTSFDLVVMADACLARVPAGSPGATGAGGDLLAADQAQALDQFLTRGGQLAVAVTPQAQRLFALERWTAYRLVPDWNAPLPGEPIQPPPPEPRALLMRGYRLPPERVPADPAWAIPVGFGCVELVWVPELQAAGAENIQGTGQVRWQATLARQLAARDPRLQPNRRIDADGYLSVFDPQTARLPQRLLGQVWWFLAVVVIAGLAIGVQVLRRPAPPPAPPAPSPPSSATASRAWLWAAGGLLVVAAVASLYGTRPRLSAIEWRLQLIAADGRRCEQRWTYLQARSSVGGLRLAVPAFAASSAEPQIVIDGWPLAAAVRELQDEPGRLPGFTAGHLDDFSLEGYRPLLLQTEFTEENRAPWSTVGWTPTGLSDRLRLPSDLAAEIRQADWAVVLAGGVLTAAPPRLPTDHAGWVLVPAAEKTPPSSTDCPWQAEPLWVRGAQINLPADVPGGEDLYKPATLRWLFGRIRGITRAPVLVLFRRRAVTQSTWQVGYDTLQPVGLDDSLMVSVFELSE